jgi:ribonuclease-3
MPEPKKKGQTVERLERFDGTDEAYVRPDARKIDRKQSAPIDEFDLSDISAAAQSREEIIAAAEAAAFETQD